MRLFLNRAGVVSSGGDALEAATNPTFSNVIHLYSFDDITGSGNEEINNTTIFNNGCSVETDNQLFGKDTAEYSFGDFVGTDGSNAIRNITRFASGDFCIDTWIYLTSRSVTNKKIVNHYKPTGNCRNWAFIALASGNPTSPNGLGFYIYPDGSSSTSTKVYGPGEVPLDQWNHVAIQREGDDHYIFLNGIPGDKLTTTDRPSGTCNWAIRHGRGLDGNEEFTGSMSDFRMSLEAFYPAEGFLVPTAIFPRS